MKIAHLIWGLKAGGPETMLVDIVNEQATSAAVALIVGNDVMDEKVLDGLSGKVATTLFRRPPGSRNPWHILKLIRTLKRFSPDIIRFLSAPMVLLSTTRM